MNYSATPLTVIMPLAGKGERFVQCGYQRPKPLVQVLGRPLVLRVIESLGLTREDLLVVVYHCSLEREQFAGLIRKAFPDLQLSFRCIEHRTRGATETVLLGIELVPDEVLTHPAIVVDGDGIVDESLLASFRNKPGNVIFCQRDEADDPIYSYVEVDDQMRVRRIAEKIRLSPFACIGAYGFGSAALLQRAARATLQISNPQGGEFYVSNAVQHLLDEELHVRAELVDGWSCLGTPGQLKSWCRQQVLLKQLERQHTSLGSVRRGPTDRMDRLERESAERESGYYLPQAIPARPWHNIVFSGDTVEKSGPARTVGHELGWYKNLPNQLSQHTPRLISCDEKGTTVLMRLERVPGAAFSHLLLEDLLHTNELDLLLEVLANFHASALMDIPPIPDGATIYDNYELKLSDRYKLMRTIPGAAKCYQALMEYADEYQAFERGREALIHGDPVFTNVLLTPATRVKLVDPRGHLNGRPTLRGDANYDLAKVYQSLTGYDEILLGQDSQARVNQLLTHYEQWLVQLLGPKGLEDIRWITASLYFSLIPLHDKRHHDAFLDLCRRLMHSDHGQS